jgi:charged multivesicular body protein 6
MLLMPLKLNLQIRLVADREYEIAKEQIRLGNRELSLLALRKKKYQEQLLAKTDSQLVNLEQLVSSPCHFKLSMNVDRKY